MNKHNLSHRKLASFDQGYLVPIGLTEVLPHDIVQHSTSAFIRVQPLNTPVMHPVVMKMHHWFVPMRLLWDQWEDFITGGPDGDSLPSFPTMTAPNTTGYAVGSLADYLGIPPGSQGSELVHSALPFRAYQLIANEWYRDQDLTTEIPISTSGGNDPTTPRTLFAPCWEKDYFTTARPWTQKGPQITIPLGTEAPVITDGQYPQFSNGVDTAQRLKTTTGSSAAGYNNVATATGDLLFGSQTGLKTDLSSATSAQINDLRTAFALQQYEENRARYGSRYTEYLRAAFGVRSSDARLQRPEYLGGGKGVIQFSEVLQTGIDSGGDPGEGVGNLLGHGVGGVRSRTYRRFFEEHGYIVSLAFIQPRTMYTQGLNRTWNRRTKHDFFQKELQFIGQQEILNKELYVGASQRDGTFGYQDRYDEYRRQESSIAGEFRTTLASWHMGRIFGSEPALNSDFVTSNPTDRIYQSTSQDQLLGLFKHNLVMKRAVAQFGTPGMRKL